MSGAARLRISLNGNCVCCDSRRDQAWNRADREADIREAVGCSGQRNCLVLGRGSLDFSLDRMKTSPHLAIFICLIFSLAVAGPTMAQNKQVSKPPSSCQRDDALNLIQQQLDASQLIDDAVKRIAVVLRAADLLWPYRQDKARAAFTQAFDLATQNFKEKGDEPRRGGVGLMVSVPDQRYTVITAIAKRDSVWAHKLSDQMLKEETKEAEEKPTKDAGQEARAAEKLLVTAYNLLSSDQSSALSFARISLRYPATLQLPVFLYSLWALDKATADRFYQEALTAYAASTMDQFLYLSSYPFGNNREAGEMPSWTYYRVPENFTPNQSLQRLFLQTLLRRAQQLLESPIEAGAGSRFSESDQIWMALTRLQAQVSQSLPELVPAVQRACGNMFAILSQREQQRVSDTVAEHPKKSFDEVIEDADRQANPAMREQMLALAILGARNEPLEHVLSAVAKIDDSALADKILNWVYFERAQQAIKDNKLDEGRKLAAKVVELDQRAYLYSRIAEDSVKNTTNDQEARDLLEEVVTSGVKAPDTEVKARALLGAVYLYAKIEPNRAIAILGDVVKCINHIESPDFSHDYVRRKIEGRSFGSYASFTTPGFNPENGFREIAKYDFDGVLNLSANFEDKPLRAMTTLALAEQCLKNSPRPPRPEKPETKITKT